MKIGDYVPIKENGKYKGQNMEWTEYIIEKYVLQEDTIFYHSAETKITEFKAKQTCFYEGYTISGYIYALHAPAGTVIEKYPCGERRIQLKEGMSIRYLGRMISVFEEAGYKKVREISRYTGIVLDYLKNEPLHWETV